jgi:ATP-dependent Clp protease ATP-binding subunit ClpC
MKIAEYKESANKFWPAVTIDRFFGDGGGSLFRFVVYAAAILFGVTSLLSLALSFAAGFNNIIGQLAGKVIADFGGKFHFIYGFFFIFLSVELLIRAATAFYRSYAFRDLDAEEEGELAVTFEAAHFVLASPEMDPVIAIGESSAGLVGFYRLGLSKKELLEFIKNRPKSVRTADLSITGNLAKSVLTLETIAGALVSFDRDFSIFLASRKITPEDFVGAVGWGEHISNLIRRRARWWSRDRLGRIPGIGKDWAYGETPTLWKFASPIGDISAYADAPNILSARKKEVEELEKILARVRGANALIVADTDEEAMGIIAALGLMIGDGRAMPEIEHKQIYILDYVTLISATKEKSLFEAKLASALSESVRAGNIILVVKDFPALIAAAKELGSDVIGIFEYYFEYHFLSSSEIHIVATANVSSFHSVIENNNVLMRHFEKVLVKGVGTDSVLNYLKDEALRIESETKVWFLYQALREAADSAERFFFGSDLEDKAADLLLEAAGAAQTGGAKIVGREDIMRLVETKTGIPRETTAKGGDNAVLLNLENILAARIVGQEEGIKAIGSAMRRAHAGIGNPNRPMGSFLFLGPTGVGKTEMTKALADAFFGGESSILRLDMSEYRTADALERLIGNFTIGKPGVLSSMLRDKPYGVLLLDEFEKTSKDVLDLFLQILDEGVFSDMSGKKVSARNLIIIATSNAGSELIWNMVKRGGETALDKDQIITAIINQGVFKPELLNRFDGVVVFHPLNRTHLVKIAELMLKKFNKRLADKGLELSVTPELINVLVEKGTDPTFGARPMNRAIQDKVETMVADKILRGETQPGTKIAFTSEEVEAIRE